MPKLFHKQITDSLLGLGSIGGRKVVKMNDGTLYTSMSWNNRAYIYRSIDNGVTWGNIADFKYYHHDCSLIANGESLYVLFRGGGSDGKSIGFHIYTNGELKQVYTIQTVLKVIGNVSLAISPNGKELYASWSSDSSSFGGFNIYIVKGVINSETDIFWGNPEIITKYTSTAYAGYASPSILVGHDGEPKIFVEFGSGGTGSIILFSKTSVGGGTSFHNKYLTIGGWHMNQIYQGSAPQYSPSAIFVPKSVNGLTDGRYWVTWYGQEKESSDGYTDVHVAYSDDMGITWNMKVFHNELSVDFCDATITANKRNEVFVVFTNKTGDGIYTKKFENGEWKDYKKSHYAGSTRTFYDATYQSDFIEPLFVLSNPPSYSMKIYGYWIATSISVKNRHLGKIKSSNGMMEYTITTDGTMSTVNETVNGLFTIHNNISSGSSTSLDIAEFFWDAIPYGKYADSEGNLNTIEIEMGDNKWVYTFEKEVEETSSLSQVIKAVKDTNEVFLPSVKKQLIDKTGLISTANFEDIIEAYDQNGIKWASGDSIFLSNSSALFYPTVRGLSFTPRFVLLSFPKAYQTSDKVHIIDNRFGTNSSTSKISIETDGFSCNDSLKGVNASVNETVYWLAIE